MENNSLFNSKWKQANYVLSTKAYYFKTWQGYQMPGHHNHPSVEIMYVISGKCHIEIDHVKIGLTKGQFIMIDAGVLHRLVVPKKKSCRMLNLEFIFEKNSQAPFDLCQIIKDEIGLKNFFDHRFTYIVLHDTDMVYSTLKKLIYYLDLKQNKTSLYMHLLHFQLLIDIAHMWNESIQYSQNGQESHVYKALNYLHQHYDEDIKIVQLASYVSLNENYLQRLFKSQMQMTIIEYLNRFRLEKAAMFLSETDYSMLEICDMVGINSRQYFIKLFKASYGITPGAYRSLKNKGYGHKMSE